MNLIHTLVNFFKNPHEQTKDKTPEGLCPVCWGYQQYDGKIRQLFRDKQVDVNNHQESYTLIQQFVKQHLDNITLREGDIYHCPACAKQKPS
jgi:hypothetical protein